jgi:hypothetical protein
MGAITFNPKSNAADSVPVETTEVAITVAEPRAILAVAENRPGRSNITRDDIVLPRVNLVQKSGKLCDDFAPGTFLFEKQVVLAKPGDEFAMVVLDDKKYFQEKVEFGSPDFGRRASDEEEVRALGGTVTWGVADKPYFQSVADFMVAIAAPAGATQEQLDLFPFLAKDGTHYAAAVYTVAASAYTSLAKRIFTDKLYTLKDGLHLAEYRIHSELKRNAANSWYVPVAGMPRRYNDAEKTRLFEEMKGI